MPRIDETRAGFVAAIGICGMIACGCSADAPKQALGHAAADTSEVATRSDEGMDQLYDAMKRLVQKRDRHTAEFRSLKDETERQKRSGEFPPIEKELEELVVLESTNRGNPVGCKAVVHLSLLASSYSGTERPVHHALDKVLVELHSYGHLREIAIAFQRLANHDGMATLDALNRLIEAESTLPFVRESARLCRARWQLEMVVNRSMNASSLEELSDPEAIKQLQEYLTKNYPSEEVAEKWKSQAISELDELASTATDHHVIVFKADDSSGILLTEDTDSKGPTIAALAKGLSFRSKHLTPGSEAPSLDVELVSGEGWRLREQVGKFVIVQFSFKGCAPCERMYPVLRDIVREYPERVSVLSIMADANITTTREAADAGNMTWDVTWDGPSGPVATEWGVKQFPSVFLFGADQKLLGSDIPGEYLAEAVAALTSQDAN